MNRRIGASERLLRWATLLATLLWGNTGEERARHNLRQSLARIRQTFGDIVASDDQYGYSLGLFGIVGQMDYEDELVQDAHCLDMVEQGAWPAEVCK